MFSFDKIASECNKGCTCEFTYSPICSASGITYASPCLAGCKYANISVNYIY